MVDYCNEYLGKLGIFQTYSLVYNGSHLQFQIFFKILLSSSLIYLRGHSITTLTTFCSFLTTYLPLLTIVDILATTYLMSTLTLTEVPPIIFSSNMHLILNSILWIGVLNFANISKWHTLLQLKKLNNVFSWYFNPH